ncbi:NAD(P)-dependent oxidoreductase [Herbiconiux solani]|uniref:NAD(P)-dependent oxidoreductase n=1 Tax=Herbiconiux solani TaxID=661329 RepID=UPI000824F54F|nr:NAD(P)-dependent oxidoreductase [Herbiconiux solani]
MRIVVIGDAFVSGKSMAAALEADPGIPIDSIDVADWAVEGGGPALHALQHQVELHGPDAVEIPEELRAMAASADVLVVHFLPVGSGIIGAGGPLRTVAIARAGTENVDTDAAASAGIRVVNIGGRNAPAVAEMALGLIIAERRNIARAHLSIATGGWRKDFVSRSRELGGYTVGLVGYGAVARHFVRLLSGFGVRVIAYDPYTPAELLSGDGVSAVELDEVFREGDAIVMFARLTDDNDRFIGRELFRSMRPTATFINTARSRLVDYDALYEALASHSIAGAGLDVFDEEPLPADSPWRSLDNVTLSPHVAGDTPESFERSGALVASALARVLGEG